VPRVTLDPATGTLLVDGKAVFPIGLSNPPPVDGVTPGGSPAWMEIAAAGVTHVRNYTVWQSQGLAEQLLSVARELDAAPAHGLQLWLGLAGADRDLAKRALLDRIVGTFKGHPGLGVWKGVDEPAHGRVPPDGCIAVYEHLRAVDPDHPVAIIEAPRGPAPAPGEHDTPLTAAAVAPYAAACDIHGVDIYPVSRPPGAHAGRAPVKTDIGVVGDVTRILARATRRKAIWTTLQIAWSGVLPPHPVVFPTLQQARFMAYDAVLAGARGLFFFGGHLRQVMTPADRDLGWNWTYWTRVQRPLLVELTDDAHTRALTAAPCRHRIRSSHAEIGVGAREAGGMLYVIAARRSSLPPEEPTRFDGLPAAAAEGIVLGHPGNAERRVRASAGAFTDPSPFGPHNARVYRFRLAA